MGSGADKRAKRGPGPRQTPRSTGTAEPEAEPGRGAAFLESTIDAPGTCHLASAHAQAQDLVIIKYGTTRFTVGTHMPHNTRPTEVPSRYGTVSSYRHASRPRRCRPLWLDACARAPATHNGQQGMFNNTNDDTAGVHGASLSPGASPHGGRVAPAPDGTGRTRRTRTR